MTAFDFWFSLGSTYTFLTVMRIEDVARQERLLVRWRPFNVRSIMQEMNNIPFVGKPAKMKYMWRDIERRAELYGIHADVPVPYPLEQFELANRVATVAADEGWCSEFVVASYQLWFQAGVPAGETKSLRVVFDKIGQSYERVVERVRSDFAETALAEATLEASSLGIFGSPSFVVDGQELFWGDDRLSDAIGYWRRVDAAKTGNSLDSR